MNGNDPLIELPDDDREGAQTEEEEQQGQQFEEEEQQGALAEEVDTGEGLPDELLSPEQKQARSEKKQREDEARVSRENEERSQTVDALRELITGMRTQAPARPAEEERRDAPRQEQPPQRLTPERAKQLTDHILGTEGGLARALEEAVLLGERRAVERIQSDPTTASLLASTARSSADRFVSEKLKDSQERFAKQIAPVFDQILDEWNMVDLARMPSPEARRWMQTAWEQAAGRVLMKQGQLKSPTPTGTGRGTGTGGGPPRRRVRQVLTQSEKDSIYKSLPNTEEGRAKAARQIAEIEYGVTSDPRIAAAVNDSARFAGAVRFGA